MGGLFHNHSDVWLLGFPGYLVAATIMIAEVQAIRTGLSLGWNLGFRSVALYTNFKEAVHAIFEVTSPALPCFALAGDICVLLDECASVHNLVKVTEALISWPRLGVVEMRCMYMAAACSWYQYILSGDMTDVEFLRS